MLVRFKRRVSFVNAYSWRCSTRFGSGMIEAGEVFEEEPATWAGVKPDDYERLPDPRDDAPPTTLAELVSSCNTLSEWILARHLPDPRRVVKERIHVLRDAAVMLPDAPPVPFDAQGVQDARTVPDLMTLVKRLRQWASAESESEPKGKGPADDEHNFQGLQSPGVKALWSPFFKSYKKLIAALEKMPGFVATRRGKKKDGTPHSHRRDVHVGQLTAWLNDIAAHAGREAHSARMDPKDPSTWPDGILDAALEEVQRQSEEARRIREDRLQRMRGGK